MKRFLLSMLLCSSITILQAGLVLHAPAAGGLLLGDNGNAAGIQRGIIMNTILSNPDFVNETNVIKTFLGLNMAQQINMSYQQIMHLVQQSTNAELSIAVIEAFEKALMHQYHYDTYAVGSYQPWQSIFFTGIKYSWMNPIKWVNPTNWISDNDPNLDQIMNEMAFLSRVVYKHSIATAQRIHITIESYRHWRRNIALTVLAYFAADACKRGLSKSSLHDLYTGGLANSPAVIEKFAGNLYAGSLFAKTAATKGAELGYKITKPVINAVLFGSQQVEPEKPIVQTPALSTRLKNWWYQQPTPSPEPQPAQKARWRDYCADTVFSYAKQVQDRYYQQPELRYI